MLGEKKLRPTLIGVNRALKNGQHSEEIKLPNTASNRASWHAYSMEPSPGPAKDAVRSVLEFSSMKQCSFWHLGKIQACKQYLPSANEQCRNNYKHSLQKKPGKFVPLPRWAWRFIKRMIRRDLKEGGMWHRLHLPMNNEGTLSNIKRLAWGNISEIDLSTPRRSSHSIP